MEAVCWCKCVGSSSCHQVDINTNKELEGILNKQTRKHNATLIRAFLPGMVTRHHGKVVFISSKAGVSPTPSLAVHSGTKHMVEAVAR